MNAVVASDVIVSARSALPPAPDASWRPPASQVHYFLGGDPAEAQNKKNDDGALAILRASPACPAPGDNLANWRKEFCWARRVRGKSAREWSGLMHQLHKRFHFTGIGMDKGGGGGWIWPELRSRDQLIDGMTIQCRPITTRDDASLPDAHQILVIFIRSHYEELWPAETMRGDDVLIDNAHRLLIDEFETGGVGLPTPRADRDDAARAAVAGWPREQQMALAVLEEGMDQLLHIQVRVDQNGDQALTKNNARQYHSAKRKDVAYSMLQAYMAFRLWLKRTEDEWLGTEAESSAGFVFG